MRLDWAIANLHEPGVMDAVVALCTPETSSWVDFQYSHSIRFVPADDRDVAHIAFDREEDVVPTLALLAEEGVYLYWPFGDSFEEEVDWG